jgi:hypothetical protein
MKFTPEAFASRSAAHTNCSAVTSSSVTRSMSKLSSFPDDRASSNNFFSSAAEEMLISPSRRMRHDASFWSRKIGTLDLSQFDKNSGAIKRYARFANSAASAQCDVDAFFQVHLFNRVFGRGTLTFVRNELIRSFCAKAVCDQKLTRISHRLTTLWRSQGRAGHYTLRKNAAMLSS